MYTGEVFYTFFLATVGIMSGVLLSVLGILFLMFFYYIVRYLKSNKEAEEKAKKMWVDYHTKGFN